MSLDSDLETFYREHGFGDVLGARPKTVRVYTGCLLVPLPNIETRNRYLKYHDLHHLITGYSVGRIGEGQISAWELGTGSMRESPTLGLMNLIALSTGWVLDRKKMWAAFCRGRRSVNLYSAKRREQVDGGNWTTIDHLAADSLDCNSNATIRRRDRAIYLLYVALSLGIHASIAIPAIVARTISDVSQGKSFRKLVQPSPRTDLY